MRKHKNIKIVYLTFGEILNAPLLRRQIVELLGEIRDLGPECHITVLSVLPLHTYLNHRKDNRVVRKLLGQYGIKFSILPTLVPCPLPNISLMKTDKGYRPDMRWTKLATIFLGLSMCPVIAYYYLIRGVKIFHCRSYPSSYAAVYSARLFSAIKVIFDPRSDFPEENITAGNWHSGDKDYLFWKGAEKIIIQRSGAVACISQSQLRGYEKYAQQLMVLSYQIMSTVNGLDHLKNCVLIKGGN